jgi:hypothetical protein
MTLSGWIGRRLRAWRRAGPEIVIGGSSSVKLVGGTIDSDILLRGGTSLTLVDVAYESGIMMTGGPCTCWLPGAEQ